MLMVCDDGGAVGVGHLQRKRVGAQIIGFRLILGLGAIVEKRDDAVGRLGRHLIGGIEAVRVHGGGIGRYRVVLLPLILSYMARTDGEPETTGSIGTTADPVRVVEAPYSVRPV